MQTIVCNIKIVHFPKFCKLLIANRFRKSNQKGLLAFFGKKSLFKKMNPENFQGKQQQSADVQLHRTQASPGRGLRRLIPSVYGKFPDHPSP